MDVRKSSSFIIENCTSSKAYCRCLQIQQNIYSQELLHVSHKSVALHTNELSRQGFPLGTKEKGVKNLDRVGRQKK